MTDTEQIRWNTESGALLVLSEIRGISFWSLYKVASSGIRFRDIIRSGDFNEFERLLGVRLNELRNDVEKIGWASYKDNMIKTAKSLFTYYNNLGCQIIHYGSPAYPKKLMELSDPPYWLFLQGNTSLLNKKNIIGVVGTRNPTQKGIFLTHSVLYQFLNVGVTSISGLAEGIDQVAHEASINFKIPTIAVLGTGIRKNYPRNSIVARERIIENNGLIITEYLPEQKASKENFVRRNRIQAALSDILFPVEWKIKSGTAHTVKVAGDLSRKILLPMLKGEELSEEKKYSILHYNAGVFNIPHYSNENLLSILNSNTKVIEQLSLLDGE